MNNDLLNDLNNDDHEIKDLDNLTEDDIKWLDNNISDEYKKEELLQINRYLDNKISNCFSVNTGNNRIINSKLKLCCYAYSLLEKDGDVNILNLHRKISDKAKQYFDIYRNDIPLLVNDIKTDLRLIHDLQISLEGLYQPIQMRVGKRLKVLKYFVGNKGEFERYSREILKELDLGFTPTSILNYMNLSDLLDCNLSYEYYACSLEVLYGIATLFKNEILNKDVSDPILDVFLDWGFNKESFHLKPTRICEYVEFKFNKMSEFNFNPKIYLDLYKIDVPLKNDDYIFIKETAKCGYRGHIRYIEDRDFANKYFVEIIKCKGNKKIARRKLQNKQLEADRSTHSEDQNKIISQATPIIDEIDAAKHKEVPIKLVDNAEHNIDKNLVDSLCPAQKLKDLEYISEEFISGLELHINNKTIISQKVKEKLVYISGLINNFLNITES